MANVQNILSLLYHGKYRNSSAFLLISIPYTHLYLLTNSSLNFLLPLFFHIFAYRLLLFPPSFFPSHTYAFPALREIYHEPELKFPLIFVNISNLFNIFLYACFEYSSAQSYKSIFLLAIVHR